MNNLIPDQVKKYFWGDDTQELSLDSHKDYIITTLLNKGDLDALKWLFENISKDEIRSNLNKYNLNPKSANFWHIYLK